MNLDDRKEQILAAVIENYITTAEPVGSRTLAKNHPLHLSSATIRNEMADLEEMGYLEQPHTSAGRVPSEKGYRYYVDQLMKNYKLTMDEIALLRSLMENKISEVGALIRELSAIYSKITNYTIVAVSPETPSTTVKQIQMMVIDDYNVLLILITNASTVKTKQIAVSHPVDPEFLNNLSTLLTQHIADRSINDIDINELMEIRDQIPDQHDLLQAMLMFVYECLDEVNHSEVFLGGTTNILSYPEYNNITKAKQLLEFLDNDQNVKKLFSPLSDDKQIQVLIGSESMVDEMKDCSMVLSHYRIKNHQFGAIGIIGPKRMNYSKAVSLLECFTDQLKSAWEDDNEQKRER